MSDFFVQLYEIVYFILILLFMRVIIMILQFTSMEIDTDNKYITPVMLPG